MPALSKGRACWIFKSNYCWLLKSNSSMPDTLVIVLFCKETGGLEIRSSDFLLNPFVFVIERSIQSWKSSNRSCWSFLKMDSIAGQYFFIFQILYFLILDPVLFDPGSCTFLLRILYVFIPNPVLLNSVSCTFVLDPVLFGFLNPNPCLWYCFSGLGIQSFDLWSFNQFDL